MYICIYMCVCVCVYMYVYLCSWRELALRCFVKVIVKSTGAGTCYKVRLHVLRCGHMLDIITYGRILQHEAAS